MSSEPASPSSALAPVPGSPLTPLPSEVFVRPFYELQNEGFTPPPYLANPEELARIRPPKSIKSLEQRLAELSPAERSTLDEFREMVRAAEWHEDAVAHVYTDWELLRYLGARGFDKKKAFEMITASAKWRSEVKPHSVTCRLCGENRNSHMMQFVGWDLESRPVLYSSFRWSMNRRDPNEGLLHSLEAFNHAIALMPEGVEQWINITDFVTYSHWSDGSPKQGSLVIKVLQDHLPNRLAMQILIDPPTTFWVLWKCLTPFIDEKTKNKVRFWYTAANPNIKDEFPKIFPPHVSEYLIETYMQNKEKSS